jgi:CXXX repeat peptide maturase
MINYLIVILEYKAAAFCHYNINNDRENVLIPFDVLENIINYAIKNNICINFLYGDTVLSPEYQQIIGTVDHIKMMPIDHNDLYENAVIIIDAETNLQQINTLEDDDLRNIILRIDIDNIASLSAIVKQLTGKFKRLNIILKDVANYQGTFFSIYADQLEELRALMSKQYGIGNNIEINVVTDRIYLTNMNNCNAGIEHLTIAPNGKYYVCPAFYYEDEENSVGSLHDAVRINNSQLLLLENAPICRNCDAYHCKRCVYLNAKITAEINTPSSQQCTLAHLERNVSGKLLDHIRAERLDDAITPIPEINYLDPFDVINNRSLTVEDREKHFAELLSKPLENVPVKQLLWQIYTISPKVLSQLKQLNYSVLNLQDKDHL